MNLSASNVLSALALAVSLAALWNAYLARRQNHLDALDELRRASLMKVRELEIGWQSVLNDLYHFARRVEKGTASQNRKDSVLEWVAQVRATFESSHQHVVKMRKDLESGFETVTIEEARRYLREFEGMTASINATRTEMSRRLELLKDAL